MAAHTVVSVQRGYANTAAHCGFTLGQDCSTRREKKKEGGGRAKRERTFVSNS